MNNNPIKVQRRRYLRAILFATVVALVLAASIEPFALRIGAWGIIALLGWVAYTFVTSRLR